MGRKDCYDIAADVVVDCLLTIDATRCQMGLLDSVAGTLAPGFRFPIMYVTFIGEKFQKFCHSYLKSRARLTVNRKQVYFYCILFWFHQQVLFV